MPLSAQSHPSLQRSKAAHLEGATTLREHPICHAQPPERQAGKTGVPLQECDGSKTAPGSMPWPSRRRSTSSRQKSASPPTVVSGAGKGIKSINSRKRTAPCNFTRFGDYVLHAPNAAKRLREFNHLLNCGHELHVSLILELFDQCLELTLLTAHTYRL